MNPTIKIQNLSHIYNEGSVFEKKALHNINLEIHSGEMVAIIGHTGSGKSTLIQHLNALLKPTAGQIFINGEDIHTDKKHLKSIRQQVGLVFQYPEHQLFEATVYADVCFGPGKMGLSSEEISKRAKSALSAVGLPEKLHDKSPFELSGGQKRRAAIAGVLAMHPSILVLDEPAAGLDPKGRDEILSQIKTMHESLGLTIILVSHSMDDASRLADRILVMNQGELMADATPPEIFAQSEMLTGIGLDVPQITQLIGRLNKTYPQAHLPQDIFTVKSAAEVILNKFGKHSALNSKSYNNQ